MTHKKNFARAEYDQSLHYFNMALRIAPSDTGLLLNLGETWVARGDRDADRSFYKIAMNYYRKAAEAEPLNKHSHDKLIYLASKLDVLNELAVEYNEKIKSLRAAGAARGYSFSFLRCLQGKCCITQGDEAQRSATDYPSYSRADYSGRRAGVTIRRCDKTQV
ncbi:MAG: hypothetical protein KJ967_02570 [Elusimicrobia bacterium]|nr:hypothetical protein [Elusimicrobiota bacterium]